MTATVARVYSLDDLVEQIVDEHMAADAAIAAGKNLGPLIPFPRLSAELGGHWPIGLCCMHAGPGAGKSAMCIQCWLRSDCPSVHVTLEMSAAIVLRRAISCESGQFLGRLRRGEMSADGIRAAAKALAKAHPYATIIDATTAPCPPEMLREVVARARQHDDHALTIIDSIHALAASNHPELDEYSAVSRTIESLRRFSQELNVAVLGVIERNRASMATGGISAGAASRKIEYSSEAILELANVGADEFARDYDRVNLRIAKNRNGCAGVQIGYLFHGAQQRFEESGPPWPTNGARTRSNGSASGNATREAQAAEWTYD